MKFEIHLYIYIYCPILINSRALKLFKKPPVAIISKAQACFSSNCLFSNGLFSKLKVFLE